LLPTKARVNICAPIIDAARFKSVRHSIPASLGEYLIVVVAPLAGRAGSRRAFENERHHSSVLG
jgi:hypothetical protein